MRGSSYGFIEIERLLQKDFRVHNLDLPGTGGNPELEKQDLNGHVEWLRSYVDGLKEKPVVVGHSMGSIIVSHYVAKYPESVADDVVLLSPIVRQTTNKILSTASYGAANGILAPFPLKYRKKILASKPVSWMISHYLTADRSKQREIDEMHYVNGRQFVSARSLQGDLRVSVVNQTREPSGKRTLVLFGQKDRLSSHKVVREWAKRVSVEYHEFEGAGHLINHERPTEVAKRIKRFLG